MYQRLPGILASLVAGRFGHGKVQGLFRIAHQIALIDPGLGFGAFVSGGAVPQLTDLQLQLTRGTSFMPQFEQLMTAGSLIGTASVLGYNSTGQVYRLAVSFDPDLTVAGA